MQDVFFSSILVRSAQLLKNNDEVITECNVCTVATSFDGEALTELLMKYRQYMHLNENETISLAKIRSGMVFESLPWRQNRS